MVSQDESTDAQTRSQSGAIGRTVVAIALLSALMIRYQSGPV